MTLPLLPLAEWEATKDTLHLWAQIVGKVRMAASPPQNHWWHATLFVDVRGLTTGPIPTPTGGTFRIDFDFVEHRLVVGTSGGAVESFPLEGLSVAEFDQRLHATLARTASSARVAAASASGTARGFGRRGSGVS